MPGCTQFADVLCLLVCCLSSSPVPGEGAACAALAHSFKEMGQTDLAVSYLEKYQSIAHRNKQSVAQAEACAALGSIHSAGGDHHLAVNFFEKTFDIARTGRWHTRQRMRREPRTRARGEQRAT